MNSSVPSAQLAPAWGARHRRHGEGDVNEMVRRASSMGYEAWWQRAESVGFCAHPSNSSGPMSTVRIGWCGRGATTGAPTSARRVRTSTPVIPGSSYVPAPRVVTTACPPRWPTDRKYSSPSPPPASGPSTPHRGKQVATRQHVEITIASTVIAAALMENPCGAVCLVTIVMHRLASRSAESATTTSGMCCSLGTCPNCGAGSPSPCDAPPSQELKAAGADPDTVRVSFIKIVELQARAITHIHALIRLDPPDDPEQTEWESPIGAGELATIIQHAARTITLNVADPTSDSGARTIGFGTQIDTQPLTASVQKQRTMLQQNRFQVQVGHCPGGGWRATSPSTSPNP